MIKYIVIFPVQICNDVYVRSLAKVFPFQRSSGAKKTTAHDTSGRHNVVA